MASTRTHRVDDRIVVPIAVLSGVGASLGRAEPTGARFQDIVLVLVAVGIVTWAGATARWWTLVVLCVLAATIAGSPVLTVLGLVAVAAATWIGTRQRDLPVARAAVAAVGLNITIRSEVDGFLGLTALLTIAAATIVLVSGVRRRSGGVRRWAVIGSVTVAMAAVIALLGGAVAAVSAGDELRDGSQLARDGVSLLGDGEYLAAADLFDQAADAFASASDELGQAWARPAAWLPVVAQHRSAALDLSSAAALASGDLAAALDVVDPEQLRLVNGRFDLDAIRLIEQPLVAVQASIRDLRSAIARSDSPWLVPAFGDRLADLGADLEQNQGRADDAAEAVKLAPQLLGADRERRYFIAFTTPAEARGMGGFMGNWAMISAKNGRLRLAEFGRTRDLNRGGERPRIVSGPADWLEQWGRYGFTNGPDGSTSETPWSNVTISPVFPSTAQVIAELLPQSGGGRVDGVFAMDPEVLRSLLALIGPIDVDGSEVRLDESNLLQFLLVDQYEIDDNSERVDLLEEVSRATITEVLGGALPNPTVVARELGPLLAQGRLLGFAVDPDEQGLFESVGLATSLPSLDGGDGIAAVFNNAGPNKIDVYLQRDLRYTATVDERTGAVDSTLELTLTNTADPDELPESVVGNATGDAVGTNRTLLSLYSALPLRGASVDGRRIVMRGGAEAGWIVNSAFLAIPPGGSITVTADYAGTLDLPSGYTLAVRPQPMVLPELQTIGVTASDGTLLVARKGPADVNERVIADADGAGD